MFWCGSLKSHTCINSRKAVEANHVLSLYRLPLHGMVHQDAWKHHCRQWVLYCDPLHFHITCKVQRKAQ